MLMMLPKAAAFCLQDLVNCLHPSERLEAAFIRYVHAFTDELISAELMSHVSLSHCGNLLEFCPHPPAFSRIIVELLLVYLIVATFSIPVM